MVLGKLPVPGCPTILDYGKAIVYYYCFLSPSLGDGPIQTEILSKRAI